MGGGDLNTKKSWHPSTLKNQERVWAAEQQARREEARIEELRRERVEERERDELRTLGQTAGTLPRDQPGDKLSWMYNQPHRSGDPEDYLLGKSVDKNYERLVAEDKTSAPPKNHVEHEVIPFSIRRLRGAGAVPDTQVDLARKLQEDPLAAVRARELTARAELLQNPLRLQQLAKLLKQDQERRKEKKAKKKLKKDKLNIDQLLAEKLSSLGGKKIDIATLLSDKKKKKKKRKSKSESDLSDSEEEKKKRKKKKGSILKEKMKKKKSHDSDSDDDREVERRQKMKTDSKEKNKKSQKNKRKNPVSESDDSPSRKKRYQFDIEDKYRSKLKHSDEEKQPKTKHRKEKCNERNKSSYSEETLNKQYKEDKHSLRKPEKKETSKMEHQRKSPPKARRHSSDSDDEVRPTHYGLVSADGAKMTTTRTEIKKKSLETKTEEKWRRPVIEKLTEEEKKRRIREMMSNASDREKEREDNLRRHREASRREEIASKSTTFDKEFATRQTARAAGSSVEQRIKSNVYNIQRGSRHVDEHFARR